jgi:hypothetical protein
VPRRKNRTRSLMSNPARVIPTFRRNGRRVNMEGFIDVDGKFGPKGKFHPIRYSEGYDPEEEGETAVYRMKKKRRTKKRKSSKRK